LGQQILWIINNEKSTKKHVAKKWVNLAVWSGVFFFLGIYVMMNDGLEVNEGGFFLLWAIGGFPVIYKSWGAGGISGCIVEAIRILVYALVSGFGCGLFFIYAVYKAIVEKNK
jgi:hypothetical protein